MGNILNSVYGQPLPDIISAINFQPTSYFHLFSLGRSKEALKGEKRSTFVLKTERERESVEDF